MNSDVKFYTINEEKDELGFIIKDIVKSLNFSMNGCKFLIKPNFVSPRYSAVTNLLLVESIIEAFLNRGGEVILAEGAGYEFDTSKCFDIL